MMHSSDLQSKNVDEIIKLDDGSLIQHGKFNDRVYLMKSSEHLHESLPSQLIELAHKNNYSKIFAKVPARQLQFFLQAGFLVEALIPRMFRNDEDGYFIAFYLDTNRMMENESKQFNEIREIAEDKVKTSINELPDKFIIRECLKSDIEPMAKLYNTVFPSYPFPIHKPEYLLETMQANIRYFCVETQDSGDIIALSSAEIDTFSRNAEMTDFATNPKWLNNGFGVHLLKTMENSFQGSNIKTLYTIARAISYGMNITFAKSKYKFAGRLKNNTNISGNIESMNVWYKHLN